MRLAAPTGGGLSSRQLPDVAGRLPVGGVCARRADEPSTPARSAANTDDTAHAHDQSRLQILPTPTHACPCRRASTTGIAGTDLPSMDAMLEPSEDSSFRATNLWG